MDKPISTLPRYIEGAIARYLNVYESRFKGGLDDKVRLRDYASAKTFRLRKKAPKFYEQRLPDIVNQAASALLACDVNTSAGVKKFNEIHADFLRVLDELQKSQPPGEVNFQTERERIKIKEEYRKQHLSIREEISRLEALEFNTDELGEEKAETKYQKTFCELDRLKVELKRVATYIAKMEGETIESSVQFELRCPPRSVLERLEEPQRKNLEGQISTFLENNKKRKEFPDKSAVDQMLSKLNIDMSRFKNEEMNDLSKDTLDAIRSFFREKENERRNDYFESLLSNKRLLPKEGEILKSPDDIPDSVRERLEQSEIVSKRKLDEYCEKFTSMPCSEDNGFDELEDDNEAEFEEELERTMASNSTLFARVKEEPRDDYEAGDGSDDEVVVQATVAEDIEKTLGVPQEKTNLVANNEVRSASESEISDFEGEFSGSNRVTSDSTTSHEHTSSEHMYQLPNYEQAASKLDELLNDEDCVQENVQPITNTTSDNNNQGNNNTSLQVSRVPTGGEDEELEMLGTIPPTDKVDLIEILSSDED